MILAIAAMAAIVVASNVGVQVLLGAFLTWGAFSYPLAFLVTDLTNRRYGAAAARRVVAAGFAVGILCSLIGTQVMLEFGPAVTLRIALGSGIAFLTAQLLDVAIFDRLRGGRWWRAPLASTLIGSAVDTALFFSIAFAAGIPLPGDVAWANEAVPLLGLGPALPLWVSMATADWGVKLAVAVVALMPYRMMSRRWTA